MALKTISSLSSATLVVLVSLALLLSSCQPQTGPGTSSTGTPFIGGEKGVEMSFVTNAPPAETFDAGQAPFDIIVNLKNSGEYAVPSTKTKVSIQGIMPEQFGKTAADFSKNAPSELEPKRKDSQGQIITSNTVQTAFSGLRYTGTVPGSALTFPIRARVCYGYGTIATSPAMCVRSNLINPVGGGICTIGSSKTIYNSAAPLQVTDLTEEARSTDAIGILFTIKQADTAGKVYEKNSVCDDTQTRFADRVYVSVSSPIGAITCSGLSGGTAGNNGYITLYDKTTRVSCVQNIQSKGDYIFPLTIELNYDFQSEINTNIVVKRSGMSGNSS